MSAGRRGAGRGTQPSRRLPATLLLGSALIVALACLFWLPQRPLAFGEPELRIQLASLGRPTRLVAVGPGLQALGPRMEAVPVEERLELEAELGALRTRSGRALPQPLRLWASSPVVLEPDGRCWPGILEIQIRGTVLEIHNLVPIEDYLPGVVAGELGDAWPGEALLAQAIAARTYAAWTRSQRKQASFHLTDTTAFQVYLGHVEPGRPVQRAVRSTRGLVLKTGEALLPAWYASTCGGRSTSAWEVFPEAPRLQALAGVACPWCLKARFHKWKAGPFPGPLLRELFGLDPEGGVLGLEPEGLDPSGRWRRARLNTPEARPTLPMARLRQALGLRSTLLFKAEAAAEGLILEGGGFGHGVGLCQTGAGAMAAAGRGHREILAFYYPGAEVERAW